MTRMRLLPAILVIACASCNSWVVVPAKSDSAAAKEWQVVRVTLKDGRRSVLEASVVRGDSLIGTDALHHAQRAIALTDIKSVEEQEISKGKTLGATAGAIVAIGAVVIGLSLAALSSTPL